MAQRIAAHGMRAFVLIWLGQLVSIVGSGLTGFALGVWVYQRTGSVTQLALISFSTTLPGLVISPLAGALVDRWNRRWVMILSDSGAALSTLTIVLLLLAGQLEVWHIYLSTAALSAANAFQSPAYSAAIPLLVSQQHLGRANGMVQLGQAIGQVAAPFLGGVLLVTLQLQGVVLVDIATYLFALVTLFIVHVPKPAATAVGRAGQGSLLREAAYGWTYLVARPGLFGLVMLFAASNFLVGSASVLVSPLVLSVASAAVLGSVMSVGGFGMLAGSLVMSAWGGPKHRIHGVLGFILAEGLAIALGGLRPSIPLFFFAAFGFFFSLPIVSGCAQAILQSKVVPDVQGRVFAISGMVAGAATPLAYLVAGPLADRVFEPSLVSGGSLAGGIGRIIGVGPGRGVGLMLIVAGVLTVLLAAVSYLYPRLRLLEAELPDVIADSGVRASTFDKCQSTVDPKGAT